MASSTAFLLVSVAILSLFLHLSSSFHEDTVTNAAEILSSSGYISMSLVLQLVSQTLISNASTMTIFSPSDEAFYRSGQPSFSLLRHHISPYAYSFEQLQSLPFGSMIPTLSPNRSLFVTTLPSDSEISVNDVKIDGTPVFDDGMLIVFAMDKFFDPNFEILTPSLSPSPGFARYSPAPSSNFECPVYSGGHLFSEGVKSLRSKGFSIMASFLELQLVQLVDDDTRLTVFAPSDDKLNEQIGDFKGWKSLFLRHVVPCEVSLSDLATLDDRSVMNTFLEGFWINFTRSDGFLLLNGVLVESPELYRGPRLLVHGIRDAFPMPASSNSEDWVNSSFGNDYEVANNEF